MKRVLTDTDVCEGEQVQTCGRKRRKRTCEKLQNNVFCTVKSKLSTVVRNVDVQNKVKEVALLAHEAFKRGLFFLRLFCLSTEVIPEMNVSTMRQCLRQVCSRDKRGAKLKDTLLTETMATFWKGTFCSIYSDLLDCTGISVTMQILAEQMLSCILMDTKTNFISRFTRCIACMLRKMRSGEEEQGRVPARSNGRKYSKEELRQANLLTREAFMGRWENVPHDLACLLKGVLPSDIIKNVYYDLQRDPSRYIKSTFEICKLMENECDFCFLPTRRTNIPCHFKLDTDAVAQLFIPYKQRVEMRTSFPDRKEFNNLVWKKVLKLELLNKKLRGGWTFHHEMTTDGLAVSILYSKTSIPCENNTSEKDSNKSSDGTAYPSRNVGVDPGKKNIVTLVDGDGNFLRYSSSQRLFESGLARYRAVMSKKSQAWHRQDGIVTLQLYLEDE